MKGRATNYRRGRWLLLLALLFGQLGWAQQTDKPLNDLAFVLGEAGQYSRTTVLDSLHAFNQRHALRVLLYTLSDEDSPYQTNARAEQTQLLQQAVPTLVITTWYGLDPKALQRTEVQLNPALAARLPPATAEQIVTEWLTYWSDNTPIAKDALREGLLLALFKLEVYLNALPPAGEVPTITFANPAATTASPPPLGLDQLRYSAHQGNYEQLEINEAAYPVAWKALPSGTTTTVLAQVDKETSFPPGVVFRQNGNAVSTQPGSELHQQQLTLTGQAHQQEGSLEVYASGDEDAELVGKLNTISYDALPKNLVLIALDGTIEEQGAEVQQTGEAVKRILAQAGVALNVTFQHFSTDWGDRDVPLEDNTSGMLSNYPRALKRVIRDYRQEHEEEKETAYIFLAGESSSGRKGYMPKKRNYGFVFVHNHRHDESLARTIAHELGHGWFRLEHSWQTYPTLTQGSSDNLMDYGAGTRLRKYQWDFVHDPMRMLGWFQDEDDVSDLTNRTDVEWIVEIYSPWYSNEFNTAFQAKDQATMSKWINKGLITAFSQEQIRSLSTINELIPRKKDGSIPVAILKHYPKAKHRGLYVYYCEKKGAVVQAVKEPIVFATDLPVDISLHTGEFDGAADEKTTPMKKETVEAFGNLAYDFVWQTTTEQGVIDKAKNYLKEVWDYQNVGRDETVVNTVMENIAETEFDLPYIYPLEEKVLYTYDFALDDKKVPLALHILVDEPSFKRNDLIKLDLGDSQGLPYAVLAFCQDKDPTKAKVLVQVGKEYVDQIKKYFTKEGDNVLADGTLLGDPFPNLSIVPSGDYGKEGGRFGCTRTSLHAAKCRPTGHAYVTPRGAGIGSGGRFHSGIDLYAKIGIELHSILEGEVFSIDEIDDGDLGISMIIKSSYKGQDVYLKYCHLNEISKVAKNALKTRSKIKQGAVIGLTGNTGNAKGIDAQRYHVHIEASTDGKFYGGKTRIDSEQFLKTKFDNSHEAIN